MTWCRRAVLMLAAIATTAAPARAQEIRLERPLPTIVDIVGNTWRVRYGTAPRADVPVFITIVSPERAYFVHGPWLRWMDTAKGTVIGRWRFPGDIDAVIVTGDGSVDVRVKTTPWHANRTLTVHFNPAAPQVPRWDTGALLPFRTAEAEALSIVRAEVPLEDWPAAAPAAIATLPRFDDLIARDPSAPLFRLMRAKLLRESGDPRADAAFEDVFDASSDDFSEWLRVAAILNTLPRVEPVLVDRAFDRALRDFIRRGRDPRLIQTLIARLIVFPQYDLIQYDESRRRWYLDHLYLLAPTSEGSERGWASYADALERQGDTAAAATWRSRADASTRESLELLTVQFEIRHDRGLLIALAAVLAAAVFIVTRRVKYNAQLRMRRAASARSGEKPKWVFGGLAYWSRRERFSLLLIVIIGWLAIGYSRVYARVMGKAFAEPVHVGAFSGEDFERYPASAERALLEAIALQSLDNAAEAERLYQSIPQFAESWNNLGVLLSQQGKDAESRDAFARAIAIDPSLGEAIFNSTGQATTPVTQTFEKYAPAGMKMIALPSRENFIRAYLGPVWIYRYAFMWLGPLDVFKKGGYSTFLENALIAPVLGGAAVLIVILILAIAVMFVPRRDATVPPGRATGIVELVFPGLSAVWQWAGPFILLLWCTGILGAALQVTVSSPYLLMAVAQPGILRAFGYPSAYTDLNPPMLLLLGVPIALWFANAILLRSRRVSHDMP